MTVTGTRMRGTNTCMWESSGRLFSSVWPDLLLTSMSKTGLPLLVWRATGLEALSWHVRHKHVTHVYTALPSFRDLVAIVVCHTSVASVTSAKRQLCKLNTDYSCGSLSSEATWLAIPHVSEYLQATVTRTRCAGTRCPVSL